jgi:uncharacterized protein YjbI with pentapeptide repeats
VRGDGRRCPATGGRGDALSASHRPECHHLSVPQPPQRPSISLAHLEPGDAQSFVSEREHDGVEFADVDLSRSQARDREIVECLFTGVTLDDAVLSGSRIRESRLERCTATSLRLDACALREVELDGCRIGALDAYDADLRQVRLTQCRLGYVNLRGSQVTDVELVGCHVEDLDLGAATVERMAFRDCTIDHLLLPEAQLSDVDLRGATLSQITSPGGLEGATISTAQLGELAPVLAAHLGIVVD